MDILTYLHVLVLCNVLSSICGGESSELAEVSNDEVTNLKSQTKSFANYARSKIANLHGLREQLERNHGSRLKSVENAQNNINSEVVGVGNYGVENITRDYNTSSAMLLSPRNNVSATTNHVLLNLEKAITPNHPRNGFLSKLLPKTDILKKLARMRETLEPNLRKFLTSKYNDFLTNLVPYSEGIGVAPFMLNSMKIPENFDPRWDFIQHLLETSSLEQFLNTLPEFSNLALFKAPVKFQQEKIQARSDDDFISDQEPQATSKGKKKYGTLRLPTRVKVYRKGDSGIPERTGYEYSGFGDQYGLYSSYDAAYGKGYDDYSVAKGSNYDDYSKGSTKGGSKYVSGTGNFGEAFASGHNSYSTHGGHGGGSYTSNLGSYFDPFSVLGGLAFLVYLGLLFQQSLNMTAGRSMSDPIFGSPFKKPLELTRLNFNGNEDKSLDFNFRSRQARALGDESIERAVNVIQAIWRDIQSLKFIEDIQCRHQRLCQIILNMETRNLLPVFIEALEKQEDDKKFLDDILNQINGRGNSFDCQVKPRCEGYFK